ncbi:hypothetical protein [Paraburkholderia tuberum]|uniref:Uncharacterized protein n=1 Tax=Paraburkholderia tuberum TaxID=157910 RepID=A0A1H0ZNF6_9BURK|nr:hypothetical protein [Paraburkholderia tuberum]SDQ29065.1 hypothetical protein SAMN05445850_0140 [Paraburkholderia tuberum]
MTSKHAYVTTHRGDVAAAARWLLHEFDPAAFAAVCLINDTPEYRAELAANAERLGKLFQKMAKRQRSGDEFEARIPRDLARWFGGLLTPIRWHRHNLTVACHAAANSRSGRPRPDKIRALHRVTLVGMDERYERRLRARIRQDREVDELVERLVANGGSIIGGAF